MEKIEKQFKLLIFKVKCVVFFKGKKTTSEYMDEIFEKNPR